MNRHGRVLRTHGLALVAQKANAAPCENLRRLRRDGGSAGDQDPRRATGSLQNRAGIRRFYVPLMTGNEAVPHEDVKVHPVDGFPLRQEMERSVHMGAVVGAHGKGRQVIQVSRSGGAAYLPLRRGIAGVNAAGKDLLRNIIYLHFLPPSSFSAFPRTAGAG